MKIKFSKIYVVMTTFVILLLVFAKNIYTQYNLPISDEISKVYAYEKAEYHLTRLDITFKEYQEVMKEILHRNNMYVETVSEEQSLLVFLDSFINKQPVDMSLIKYSDMKTLTELKKSLNKDQNNEPESQWKRTPLFISEVYSNKDDTIRTVFAKYTDTIILSSDTFSFEYYVRFIFKNDDGEWKIFRTVPKNIPTGGDIKNESTDIVFEKLRDEFRIFEGKEIEYKTYLTF